MMVDIPVEKDLKESYLTYAMSVIVGRALPDVRDGLKPVHRRILYAMKELGNTSSAQYKKSARVVGEVLGKYHPHGDMAIYDSLVRMAQDFSLRYTLVDGQGNFGSIDGDAPAAMRYTEVRMSRIAEEMLEDIEKETVDFAPNFDGSLKEPVVLPAKIPNLLINGSSGIAVGMATNIPPHNINEICDALIAIIDGKGEEEVLGIVKGPDFPTGGVIVGRAGIISAYKTGKGIIRVRARAKVEDNEIIITEIPYQVTKTKIIEDIVEAVKAGKIDGIADVQDRSDKTGMELRIKIKKNADAEAVLKKLYAYTGLESSFGIINVALVGKQPKLMSLIEMLNEFLNFRREIVRKRTAFVLKKAEERAHIVEGLLAALRDVDNVVSFLRKTKEVAEAVEGLKGMLKIDEAQAKAILDMKLQKLVGLEQEKLNTEYEELKKNIEWCRGVLESPEKVDGIIKEELMEIKKKYGDERKTEISSEEVQEFFEESLIEDKEVVITVTMKGYVKRTSLEEYRKQGRGGKGVIGVEVEEDGVRELMVTTNKATLLAFTDKGKVHWLKAYEIPEADRYGKGKPIVNLIQVEENEKVLRILPTKALETGYVFFLTKKGIAKRTAMEEFSNPRRGGIRAFTLKEEGDELIEVAKTSGKDDVILATRKGMAIRFGEEEIREVGRNAAGVIGIRLREGDEVASLTVCNKPTVLTVTTKGYGKRTEISEYRKQGRGGTGVINLKATEKNGLVVGVKAIDDKDEVILITSKGKAIRIPANTISVIGRATQGVRLIRLEEGEEVSSFDVFEGEGGI
ncbi:MAG: DNA gyrase subunit A [Candidatus Anstonellales archaeon]